MKIAWIVPGFSSDERDGCIPALLDLAHAMSARHDLHIFALHYPYRRDRYSVYHATVHSIGGANRGRRALPGVWRAAMREVAREHRLGRFDALHAFWAYEPGVIAAWLKWRLGVRAVISLAGGELVHLPDIGYGLAGRGWLLRAIGWALRRANAVTAGSHYLLDLARAAVRDVPADRFAFAPLGVDAERFAPAQTPAARKHDGPPTILNVGSLEPVKAQADLIRAFRYVVDRERAARLVIAGAGRLRSTLESLAAELEVAQSVTFAGDVHREHLPVLYSRADVFAQASRHEAQGMAAVEAAACGLPVLGTAVGVVADWAPEAAIAVPPGDPLRLAQAILTVLEDPARRRALGDAARARVESAYRLETAAQRFERLYSGS